MEAGVLDHDRRTGCPRFKTERRIDCEFATRFHAKMDVILHSAGGPVSVGHASDYRKSHAGYLAQHGQQRRHGINTADGRDGFGSVFGAIIHKFALVRCPGQNRRGRF
jgi:hypothetical protein